MLEAFGPSLFVADGGTVPFLGFPYPTRMAIARLADGGLWVWSPIALSPELERAVDALGPVRHVVSPNKLHHLFLDAWAERWPDARFHAPPGLARRKPALRFDAELGDTPHPGWAEDLDQQVVRGSFWLEEVLFFHRPSRTAIVCDLVQRMDPARLTRLQAGFLRLNGLVGEAGSTPLEWRASFLRRRPAREARAKLLAWKPEQLVIAHGFCARTGADRILERALAWI